MSALRSAVVIGFATLLESIRSRILLTTLAFALVLIGLSVSAASVSMGERSRLIIDVGFAAASALGTVIAVALTITSFGRELERRTAYPVLVRPLPRWAFVLGKYLGLWVTMTLVTTLMLLATFATVLSYGADLPSAALPALFLSALEMAVVVAIALLFSTFATPVLAATYSLALLLAGNLSLEIARLAQRMLRDESAGGFLMQAASWILPNIEALSVRSQAANALEVPWAFVGIATIYAVAYACASLSAAMLVFARKRSI